MSLTKASYSMITGAVINVLDYGAIGNGIADDTAAITAAVTAASAGSTVYFPVGTYKVTSGITDGGKAIMFMAAQRQWFLNLLQDFVNGLQNQTSMSSQ